MLIKQVPNYYATPNIMFIKLKNKFFKLMKTLKYDKMLNNCF